MTNNLNYISLEERIRKIMKEYILIPHTRSSRFFSTIRRMKAEKELNVPINQRANFIVSTKTGQRTNEMTETEWEKFYETLSKEFKADYPDTYNRLFSIGEKFCQRCGTKNGDHYSGGWMGCMVLYGKKNN